MRSVGLSTMERIYPLAGFNIDGDSSSKSKSDVDIEQSRDSGYDSNLDNKAEYLNGLIERFEEEGP